MPLKISRRHGTAVWYIRGTVRGVSVDESTKVTDKEQAEAKSEKEPASGYFDVGIESAHK